MYQSQRPQCVLRVCEKFAENPEFRVGTFAVNLKREIFHAKLKCHKITLPPCTFCRAHFITLQQPSVTLQPASVTLQLPLVTHQLPSVDLQPLSITSNRRQFPYKCHRLTSNCRRLASNRRQLPPTAVGSLTLCSTNGDPGSFDHGGRRQPMCDPEGCVTVLGAVGGINGGCRGGGGTPPPPLG